MDLNAYRSVGAGLQQWMGYAETVEARHLAEDIRTLEERIAQQHWGIQNI